MERVYDPHGFADPFAGFSKLPLVCAIALAENKKNSKFREVISFIIFFGGIIGSSRRGLIVQNHSQK